MTDGILNNFLQFGFRFGIACCVTVAVPARGEELLEGLTTDFNLRISTDAFLQEPGSGTNRQVDDRTFRSMAVLTGDFMLPVGESLTVNASAYLRFDLPSNQQGVGTVPHRDNDSARYADFTKLNLVWETDDVDVIVGKADVKIGFAELFSPLDRFNAADVSNPMHPVRHGLWQVRGKLYADDDTFSVALFPYHTAYAGVSEDSRWRGGSSDGSFFSSTGDLTTELRSPGPANWSFLGLWEGVREGYDFLFGLYHGQGAYPVVNNRAEVLQPFGITVPHLYKIVPTTWSAMGGLSVVDGSVKYYAEGYYQWAQGDKDQDFVKGVLGVKYTDTALASRLDLNQIRMIGEFSADARTDGNREDAYPVSSSDARILPNAILCQVELEIDDTWTVILGGGYGLEFHDSTEYLRVSYKVNDDFSLKGSVTGFQGPDGTQFGRWRENDLFILEANYAF